MLNKLDYSFNNEESILQRVNPVVKFFCLFIYLLLSLLKFNNIVFIFNISFVFFLLLISNINILRYLKIIWKLKYIIIIIYLFMISKQIEFMEINIFVFKWLFFILYFFMIIYTTTKEDIGKGAGVIVNRFNLIGLSIKSICTFFTHILVYVNYFIDTFNEVTSKTELNGKDYTHANIIDRIKLNIKNIKKIYSNIKLKMKNRKSDMKYRLYNSKVKSKYKYRNRLCIYDYVFVIYNIGMIVYYVLKVR